MWELKSLKNLKFRVNENTICEFNGYYGLFHKEKGFASFKNNVLYSNTKKVIQSIIEDGGLINHSKYVYPID